MMPTTEGYPTPLAIAIDALLWVFSSHDDDVTLKDHYLRCHQCGQWQPDVLFIGLPPVECRPVCGPCRVKTKTPG